ncbi:carbon-nitrogen hydrolase family protein [Aquimarina sp. AU474]|uniref:carbon-nitrogen hydrolase family protein n=1 Tax=Aquimarina sp. AU474 TaxID=2108529 RepID=UPI000D68634A|nr:carbon-nitrogen hydrolase family protein [Aquimarina sp. AU474]
MKVCVAQIKSEKGNISNNIENHKKWIDIAVSNKVDLILFPELSLTGYEPKLAKKLTLDQNDSRLDIFQEISDLNNITIAIGLPTKSKSGVCISMTFFQQKLPKKIYSKLKLHPDEFPYFIAGKEQVILTIKHKKIAPAICYESLLPKHIDNANTLGAKLYVASVAKTQNGIEKALTHFPKMAKKYNIPIFMSNCIGFCDNFEGAGQSAIWNEKGELIGQLDHKNEGILILDTETKILTKRI